MGATVQRGIGDAPPASEIVGRMWAENLDPAQFATRWHEPSYHNVLYCL